ncbi:MAG TPA: hypothetical protein VMF61_08665 [Candidatus Acidoferrales bacterium]|nr:hypothetical protein [Candidatus Acidoferrales bacterium]
MAAEQDWDGARGAIDGVEGFPGEDLRAFFERMSSRERGRSDALATMRHDLANAVTVALANLEGMIDGAVAVTPARLRNVCDALHRAQGLLAGLRGNRPS